MKTKRAMQKYLPITILFVLSIYLVSQAQDVDSYFQTLKDNTTSVKGKRSEYSQEISRDEAHPFLVFVVITEVGKGDVVAYSVNTKDLNPTIINFEPKSDLVHITAQVKGGKKLVKVVENGELDNYDDEFLFYASDIEQARTLTDALKGLTKLAEKQEDDKSHESKSKAELSSMLSSSVGEVVINDDSYQQSLKFDESNPNIWHFELEDVSKGSKEEFFVNAADLNPHKIDFETQRNEVFVYFTTKGDTKLVRYMKDGELANYDHEFEMKMNSIEDARMFAKLTRQFVKHAEEEEKEDFGSYSYEQCAEFLAANVGEVVINQDAYEQSFTTDPDNELIFSFSTKDISQGSSAKYSVNAADLRRGKTNFDTKGNEVLVELNTSNDRKLIKTMEDNELSNYQNSVTLRAKDVENARALSEVFSRFKELAHQKMDEKIAFSSTEEAEKYIIDAVDEIVIDTDTYQQEMEKDADNPCIYTYRMTDVSKDTQYAYEFNFRDIDLYKIQFDTKGSEVLVLLEIKGKNKLIKTYKDGEADSYDYDMEIKATDIEEARNLVSALKKKTESCGEE